MSEKVDPKEVRVWAQTTGRTVGKRGRLNAELVAEYVAAKNGVEPQSKPTPDGPHVEPQSEPTVPRLDESDLPF